MPDHRSGTYVRSSVAGEECRAFIPPPLPPDPPLSLTAEDHDLIEKANRALGRLDGLATPSVSISIETLCPNSLAYTAKGAMYGNERSRTV
jgi:hypothetical protein